MFSRDWTDAVDVLVVAVQERSEECWWVMISCSPPASGGEHIEFFEKVELKMLEQRERLGRHYIEELVDRSLLLQDAGARRHSSTSCVFVTTLSMTPSSTVSYSTAEAPSRGFVNAACCGVDAFRQRRVDVHRVRDVVGSRPEFDGEDEFVDDLGALFADDVRSE